MFKDDVDTSFGYLLRLSIAGKRSCLKIRLVNLACDMHCLVEIP